MDTIWNVAYGVDLDLQNNPTNPYFVQSEKTFAVSATPNNPIILFASNKYFFLFQKITAYNIYEYFQNIFMK
jgi:hypothetical protein